MKKLLATIALLIAVQISTKAQTFTCPLMGWTATTPTGWQMEVRENRYTPVSVLTLFRNDAMGMGSSLADAPPTSSTPLPTPIKMNPEQEQGIMISKADDAYIVIETHETARKHVKRPDNYNPEREEEIVKDAARLEQYPKASVATEHLSDTQRIDGKLFYTLQFNIKKHDQVKLRIYTYRWYHDKYELHATIVARNTQYLQEMQNILSAVAGSIKE